MEQYMTNERLENRLSKDDNHASGTYHLSAFVP